LRRIEAMIYIKNVSNPEYISLKYPKKSFKVAIKEVRTLNQEMDYVCMDRCQAIAMQLISVEDLPGDCLSISILDEHTEIVLGYSKLNKN
jgi:hypothetical protein